MKYELIVRPFEDSDVSIKCPYLPNNEDLDMYLDTLIEDIATIQEVEIVERNQLTIEITTGQALSNKDLKAKMKPYFSDDRFCKYKFVSLETK